MFARGRDGCNRAIALAAAVVAFPSRAAGQTLDELGRDPVSLGEGWLGFLDFGFLVNTVLTLTVAAVLGAVVAYHPRYRQTTDTVEEIDAPKAYVMCSVIGAIIGILVVKYGLVVGFVLFGIGGLIRFRTILQTPGMTGQVIYVTLIGLACGLDLPHVAVVATAFGFALIYLLETRVTYRMDVRGLPPEQITRAATAYRHQLENQGCNIFSEKKSPEKARVTFLFRADRRMRREQLEKVLETTVEPPLRGTVDWGVD
ncbi:MAG TPA: MgtC/SapB family protein [Gammaproteobacteria bacterium]|nr:MgtC/SapB family protein [Gammaproteobacteria bacterium]